MHGERQFLSLSCNLPKKPRVKLIEILDQSHRPSDPPSAQALVALALG